MLNIHSSLVNEMRAKEYRDGYVSSQLQISLPFQIRALRKSKLMTQPELAEKAGMSQPRISEIEKPGERSPNVDTLLRLASAFDVALQVRFVPFSELIAWSESASLDRLKISSFVDELKEAETFLRKREKPHEVDDAPLEMFKGKDNDWGGLTTPVASVHPMSAALIGGKNEALSNTAR